MNYLHKLKDTVTQAIPGNVVLREFTLGSQVGSAGPGLLWKIYSASHCTTKQEASIFMLEKKLLDRFSRFDRDLLIETLRRGVTQLTKLRHPKILSIVHPLEDSRDSLAFATEPVFCSLANALGSHHNLSPPPTELLQHKLYDIEIKYGLLQLAESLAFLHNDVKLLHGNINPSAIIICKSGAWRLSGFEFSVLSSASHDATHRKYDCDMRIKEMASFTCYEWRDSYPPPAQPALEYLAPEFALRENCSTGSDIYSFAILIYAIFNRGKPLFECDDSFSTFRRNIEQMQALKATLLGALPEDARDHVKLMLNPEPSVRPDAVQLSQISFFDDVGVKTLQFLDTLVQRDNLQRSHFFKGLPPILQHFPKRVLMYRVLPSLFAEFGAPNMVPFVLPCVLVVAEEATPEEFASLILPSLSPAFCMTEPIQIMLILLQNMPLLLSRAPPDGIRDHVLPMVYRALECDTPQIQTFSFQRVYLTFIQHVFLLHLFDSSLFELTLKVLPTFAALIEYASLKNAVMPRIKRLCLGTRVLSVRVNCLICTGKLMDYMDRWFVLDDVLPIVHQIPSREPAVLMSMLGIYRVALTHDKLGITKEILATKVLPFLMPILIENSLNLRQFNAYFELVGDMLSRVEAEQRTKLKQLDDVSKEQTALSFSAEPLAPKNELVGGITSAHSTRTTMDSFMADLGIETAGPTMSNGPAADSRRGSGVQSPKKGITTGTAEAASKAPPSLSLEEKQRLAREQEMQYRLKEQRSLAASRRRGGASRGTSPTKTLSSALGASRANYTLTSVDSTKATAAARQSADGSGGAAKDLTNTLMNQNMMNLSLTSTNTAPAPTPSVQWNNSAGTGVAPMQQLQPGGWCSTASPMMSTNNGYGLQTQNGSFGGGTGALHTGSNFGGSTSGSAFGGSTFGAAMGGGGGFQGSVPSTLYGGAGGGAPQPPTAKPSPAAAPGPSAFDSLVSGTSSSLPAVSTLFLQEGQLFSHNLGLTLTIRVKTRIFCIVVLLNHLVTFLVKLYTT